jgi:hypothetical protein
MAGVRRHAGHPFDAQLNLPARREVVFVQEPLGGTKREARQRHRRGVLGENGPADVGYAVIPPMDPKPM